MTTVSVYAEFPKVISAGNLDLDPANWSWCKCLAIPVTELADLHLSLKPYKWIRFATGVVVGAEGHLSLIQDLPTVPINYDEALPTTSVDLYYHFLDNDQRSGVFPLDSYMDHTRSTTEGSVSTRRAHFRDEVEERDGVCVLTGVSPRNCDAVHLLSHSKGDAYIRSFTTGRDPTGSDIIHDIDSVRNGLLLARGLHRPLGRDFAILVTPNFAMATNDVVQDAEDVVQDAKKKRYTAHVFDSGALESGGRFSGCAIRVSKDKSSWPPAVLFDAVYASAVIYHFGELPDDILKTWESIYYPGGIKKLTRAQVAEEAAARDERRRRRNDGRGTLDGFDLLRILPYIVAGPEQYMRNMKDRREAAAAREREELEAKVDSWRQNT